MIGFWKYGRPAGRPPRDGAEACELQLLVVCCLVGGGSGLQAGGGPENVALVVNADSWASKALANHYVQWRQIPPSNVVYLEGLTSFEQTDVETFREKILVPVFKTLFERDLLEHVDYIVYSADFPTAIDASKDLGGAKPAKHLSPTASITGLTYLYQLVLAKNPHYIELLTNFYARRPLRDVQTAPDDAGGRRGISHRPTNWSVTASGRKRPARWERWPSGCPAMRCCNTTSRAAWPEPARADAALRALEQAVAAGWSDGKHTQEDPDLESLRSLPAFDSVVEENGREATGTRRSAADVRIPLEVPRGTRPGPACPSDGVRYVLSTMLAVTSGRGNSVREALDYLQRSVAADATNPRGTIYFMENSDVRSTTRKWAFASTVKALEGTGVQGAIVNGSLPEKKDDVAGAMVGSAGVDWKKSGSTILPGAICEHLTSYGGIMTEGAGQTPLTEFLRYGAAGSSGTVVEPMAAASEISLRVPAPALRPRFVVGRGVLSVAARTVSTAGRGRRAVSTLGQAAGDRSARGAAWSTCVGTTRARTTRVRRRRCQCGGRPLRSVHRRQAVGDGPGEPTVRRGHHGASATGGTNCASWRLPRAPWRRRVA